MGVGERAALWEAAARWERTGESGQVRATCVQSRATARETGGAVTPRNCVPACATRHMPRAGRRVGKGPPRLSA